MEEKYHHLLVAIKVIYNHFYRKNMKSLK